MNSNRFRPSVLLSLVGLLFLAGCAVTPVNQSWRPWMRSLGDGAALAQPPATFSVDVAGEEQPLVGDEALVRAQLEDQVVQLMERRGYEHLAEGGQISVRLRYRSEEKLVTTSSTSVSSSRLTSSVAGGTSSGWGIAIASLVSDTRQVTSTRAHAVTAFRFIHIMAVEIHEEGAPQWKTDLRWVSAEPNLLRGSLTALQYVISALPSDTSRLPVVPTVRPDAVDAFLRVECDDRRFACPALPYWIAFQQTPERPAKSLTKVVASTIEEPRALAAVVDLLQTAELALPTGGDRTGDLLRRKLWSTAAMGGSYRLEPSGDIVHVIVELKGSAAQYRIESARVVSADEMQRFQATLETWRRQVREFFEVYQ